MAIANLHDNANACATAETHGNHIRSRLRVKVIEGAEGEKRKYHVTVVRKTSNNLFRQCVTRGDAASTDIQFVSKSSHWQYTRQLIHWMLKANNFNLILFMIFMVFSLTFLFALVLIVVANTYPLCVTSPNIFGAQSSFEERLHGAWQLSWTTFSTVGYGWIAPATSAAFESLKDFKEYRYCAALNVVLSFECLFGVLFSSFAGAIIFGKLTQFQSIAQVKFSNVMVVIYGDGLADTSYDDDASDSEQEDEAQQASFKKLPCPVLKFRLANLLKSKTDGHITNCNVSIVATVNLKNALSQHVSNDVQFRNALQSTRNLMAGNNNPNVVAASAAIVTGNITKIGTAITSKLKPGELLRRTPSTDKEDVPTTTGNMLKVRLLKKNLSKDSEDGKSQLRPSKLHGFGLSHDQIKDIGNMADSVDNIDDIMKSIIVHEDAQIDAPSMVFAKIPFSPEDHPCFTTNWLLMHTLDADSPLLKKSVRKQIEKNGGYWPSTLDTEDDIKDSIDFDQIMVSFKGLSRSTGNEVYHNHVYKLDDLRVGFNFQSMLVDVNGMIGIDDDKIDNIEPQPQRSSTA